MMITMFLVFETINLKNVCLLYFSYDDDCIAIISSFHKCSISSLSCREDGLYLKREV